MSHPDSGTTGITTSEPGLGSNLPIYDENGYYYSNEGGAPAMGLAQGGTRLTDRDETYQQAGLTIEPLKNWFIRGEFNYRIDQSKDRQTRLPIYDHYVDGSIKDMQYSSSLYQSFFRTSMPTGMFIQTTHSALRMLIISK